MRSLIPVSRLYIKYGARALRQLGSLSIKTEIRGSRSLLKVIHTPSSPPSSAQLRNVPVVKLKRAALLQAPLRKKRKKEIWSRKSRLNNRSMSLKAYQTPKDYTVVYSTRMQGYLSSWPLWHKQQNRVLCVGTSTAWPHYKWMMRVHFWTWSNTAV